MERDIEKKPEETSKNAKTQLIDNLKPIAVEAESDNDVEIDVDDDV